jgi:hypothetical protein
MENQFDGVQFRPESAQEKHSAAMLTALNDSAFHRNDGFAGFAATASGRQPKDLGFPQIELTGEQSAVEQEKQRRVNSGLGCIGFLPVEVEMARKRERSAVDDSLPVPIGLELPVHRSLFERVVHGAIDLFSQTDDKFPKNFYPQTKDIGLVPLATELREDFDKRFPTLAEYNKRVAAGGDHENDNYTKMVHDYAKTLDPHERELISKELEQYKKDIEISPTHVGIYMPEPGPHLKAYLEHVQELKENAHALEQARRQLIAIQLGPAFKTESAHWEAERKYSKLLM